MPNPPLTSNPSHGARGAAAAAGAPPVVYIMSRFPKLTETFILREIIEMERQGQPVLILPLLGVQQTVRHPEAEALKRRAVYTPFVSRDILAANLHYLRRRPRAYLGVLWSALRGTFGSANLFVGAIGIFPKSVYYARLVEGRGLRHVHAHFATHPALAALVVSELTGVGFSFTVHGHDLFLYTAMLCEKVRRARFVVTVSEYNKRHMLGLCPDVPPEKIKVVRCGVEPGRYAQASAPRPDARPARLSRDAGAEEARDGRFRILCVASLERHKGIEYLVKACALLRERLGDFVCLVAGEGGDRKRLERLIGGAGLGDTVRLLGARPQGEVAELLARADLFVLPSVRDSLPVVLMEAMASRLPVVATRLCGIPELVADGEAGLLVPAGDERALADAIFRLYEDAGLRREMGRRGAEKVAAEFQLSDNVSKLRSLIAMTVGDVPALEEKIRSRAGEYFPGFGGDAVGVRLNRLADGHNSVVYEATLEKENRARRALILKVHRPRGGAPEAVLEKARAGARKEYESLRLLRRELSARAGRFTVPKAVDLFPEETALLMEKLRGEPLGRSLRWLRLRGGARFESARRDVRACGEWLALFHEVTRREGDPFEVYRHIEREFREELKACVALGLDPALASRVERAFEVKRGLLFDGSDAVVAYHCDFGPHNVFVSRGEVSAIDFEGMRDGVACEDAAQFLGFVRSTPGRHLSRAQALALAESFLEGYAARGELKRERVEAFVLVKAVKLMAYNPRLREGGRRDGLMRRRQLRLYARRLEEMSR